MRMLCALGLLLSVGQPMAVAASPVPASPKATISFGAQGMVEVVGPSNQGRPESPWTMIQTLMSPRGDAAVVRFCWEVGKYDGCQVHLARPGRPVHRLNSSNVKHLLWTPDGQYLVGAGNNTLRLWNLSGGLRTQVLAGKTENVRALGWVAGGLCVQTREYQHPSQYGQTAHRFTVPALRWIASAQLVKTWEVPAPACL
ncbi:WD40 repeat domain-containing protein [Deinococcus sp. QL22]|uniref:WD40 repeat domain-containing protein n=1 Tax=Deinococcus sp. QL22 TaxID=2939437 RepID=UPI00201750C4|nr:hypothetical protein [Deinococcus sp. QL22]UQN10628.1 hypothetical protein M1R55_31010 [Deinococcus sp. QL22]